MPVQWVKVVDQDHSVFSASLIALGLDREYFEAATGWEYGVERHRYASAAHWVSAPDDERLARLVSDGASSQPRFRASYIDRATVRHGRLLDTARWLADLARDAPAPSTVEEGLARFSTAMKETSPFVVAGPYVWRTGASVAGRPSGGGQERQGREAWPVPPLRAEAMREMRDCYRIAVDLAREPQTADLLSTAAPTIIARRLEENFRDVFERIRTHLQDYAWLWGSGSEGRSVTELLERIQGVVLRWPVAALEEAAGRLATGPAEDIAVFGVDAHRKAESIAAPFFAMVAEMLGCRPEDVTASTPEEIAAAFGGARLPAAGEERRLAGAVVVERAGTGVRVGVETADTASAEVPARPALEGISASRGLAVGTVKILLAGQDVGELAAGDVLVTATSSPDVLGGESMFPTRAGLRGIEKAAAIVTDEGGALSHAGIVSREYRIPCVVGTGRATALLSPGQVVEVDALRPAGRVTVLGS